MSQTAASAPHALVLQAYEKAAAWFLQSGIQEYSGGVARFYRSDIEANAPVSTEITGYAVSTLVYHHSRASGPEYLAAAVRAGDWLVQTAWRRDLAVFPFESGQMVEPLAYFFDTGIIIRGLLALWRATEQEVYLQVAVQAGESLMRDFSNGHRFHPILRLPEKQPLACTPQWSRSPGCYQLKSALAWHELAEATGESKFFGWFDVALATALKSHAAFLPAETPEKTMDRLHAYAYFLEALLVATEREDDCAALAEGIERLTAYLHEIAPVFERSDVYAQLLRIRLLAHHAGVAPLNSSEAAREAAAILQFQIESSDRRLHGGFAFGRKGGQMLPYANPVSTAFCLQALAMWHDHSNGIELDPDCLI